MKIGWINPGLVISEMVVEQARSVDPETWCSARKVFNLFGESVSDTAARLAPRILSAHKQGERIHLLPKRKMLARLVTASFGRRDVLSAHGI